MLRYDGMLCYPDWEPSVEDAAFSFSTGDCGASTAIFLWKNSTGGMSVDYYVYGDLIRIGEQIWFGGGEEADFTDTVNSMITAQTENISTTLNSIGPDIQWAKQAIQNNKYEFYVIENGSPTTFTMYNLVTWRQFLRNYKGLMSNTEHFDQNSQGQITYKGIDLVYGSPLAHSSYTQGNEVWLDETILPYHGYAV